jgi:hypothetical protein
LAARDGDGLADRGGRRAEQHTAATARTRPDRRRRSGANRGGFRPAR